MVADEVGELKLEVESGTGEVFEDIKMMDNLQLVLQVSGWIFFFARKGVRAVVVVRWDILFLTSMIVHNGEKSRWKFDEIKR